MGLMRDLLIGFLMAGIVVLILGIVVGLIFLIWKFIGIGLILVGIFLVAFFPDVLGDMRGGYQPGGFSVTGIVMGIIFIIAGIVILVI
jgi:hypothetical protein